MILTFKSKAQMGLYFPLEKFEPWPEDTYSFCPKCASDNVEPLLESGREHFVRCGVCGSLWIARNLPQIEAPKPAVRA
jgi:hypothetical protein